MDKIKVVAVVGPTASGKTALAVAIAKALGGEVISADSMQIYKHMDIATAKPDTAEMDGVRHHLIDFIEPCESFSVARFCELGRAAIDDITKRGKLPVIAGGTGLYIDSLLGNTRFEDSDPDPALRAGIISMIERDGIDAALDCIRGFDPESADRLSLERNPKRIARCIEVYRTTGMTATELNRRQKSEPSPYNAVKIGLKAADRAYLYERIDRRVDIMLERGLVDEARAFFRGDFGDTAAAAIGYKELLPYLKGALPLETCAESLKRATRRYAKRQLTWFGRDKEIHWFDIDELSFDRILSGSLDIIDNSIN